MGTGTWIGMYDNSNWVKSLPDPQIVCIKPMKTHFKTQNWDKVGFYLEFKSLNPDFWFQTHSLGCMMHHDGNQSNYLPYLQFVCIKPIKFMKTHLEPHKIRPKIGFNCNFKSMT